MIEASRTFQPGDALLIVDVQNSFCPGGELPIENGDQVVPVLNRLTRAAKEAGVRIYLSRDIHPELHPSFAPQGGEWPPHCMEGTEGAAFHPDLHVPEGSTIVTKGMRFDQDQYSAFDQTGLEALMKRDGIRRIFVGGLALDVCVRATALDAAKHGFETHVVLDACRAVTPEGGLEAVEAMKRAGVVIEERVL